MHPIVHLANVLSLAAYAVTDVLVLRILAVLANASVVVYAFVADPFVWENFAWYTLFTLINAVQVMVLLHQRRPVQIPEEAQLLYERVFRPFSPRDFVRLWNASEWVTLGRGAELIRAGAHPQHVYLLEQGTLEVQTQQKQRLATLEVGQFAGEMSFMTGVAPGASVLALQDARLRAFPRSALQQFMEGSPQLAATMQLVLGTDLVTKLQKSPTPARSTG